jgi:uncharacterized protein (TIGR02001 family)
MGRNWFGLALFVMIGVALLAPPLHAEPGPVQFSWSGTLATKYLFLGVDQNAGHSVMQPELELSSGSYSSSIWFNHDLRRNETSEYDLGFGYTPRLGESLSMKLGYVYLDFPHQGFNPTQEMVLDVSYSTVLSPSLSLHRDFKEGKGSYAILSLSHPLPLPGREMTLGFSGYYQRGYYETTGVPVVQWDLGTEFDLGGIAFTPTITRTLSFENGDFRGESLIPATWLFSFSIAQASP